MRGGGKLLLSVRASTLDSATITASRAATLHQDHHDCFTTCYSSSSFTTSSHCLLEQQQRRPSSSSHRPSNFTHCYDARQSLPLLFKSKQYFNLIKTYIHKHITHSQTTYTTKHRLDSLLKHSATSLLLLRLRFHHPNAHPKRARRALSSSRRRTYHCPTPPRRV